MDTGFVVYQHFVEGDSLPFYVGEGRLKRAHSRANRNRYWRFKVEKHGGFRVEIVAQGLTKSEAEAEERRLIQKYRDEGVLLTNCAAGPLFDGHWLIGRPKSDHPMYGKRFSAPWIAESNRRRAGQKLRPRPDLVTRNKAGGIPHFKRPVRCVETGKVYESVVAAANAVGVHDSKVHRALKEGGRSGGYHWQYLAPRGEA